LKLLGLFIRELFDDNTLGYIGKLVIAKRLPTQALRVLTELQAEIKSLTVRRVHKDPDANLHSS